MINVSFLIQDIFQLIIHMHIFSTREYLLSTYKGQLISKCPFGVT